LIRISLAYFARSNRSPLLEDIMNKLYLAACLLWMPIAHAQIEKPFQPHDPPGPLTLQAALALARTHNSELAAFSNEVGATDGAAEQARAMPNPELSATWEEVGKPGRSTSLQISQLIETGGKRAARVRAAGLGRDIATAEYDAKRIDVLTRVRQAFVEVMAAQRRKQISDQAVALAAQAAHAVGKRVTAGKVSPMEETKAKLEAGAARIEAEQAARELASARKRLSAFWGNATPRFSEASGDMELLVAVPSLDTLAQRARSSPERMRAIAEVARRGALLDGEKAKRYPDFTLGAGVKRTLDTRENLPLFTISMPLPIFDRNQGSLREALKRVDKARDEQSTIDARLQSELGQTFERFKAIEMELTMLREELLPGAKSAFDAATTGYQLGKFGFLDALDAQRTLFRTNQQYVKALAEYHHAIADLERLTGEPLNAERAAMMNIE
jgi:outer membrane protein, heavy metal efflux system